MSGWPSWAVALAIVAVWVAVVAAFLVLPRITPGLKCPDLEDLADEEGHERVTAPGECERKARRRKR